MNLDYHLTEITRLRRAADQLPDDVPQALIDKVSILAKCMLFVGRLSSHLDGDYKRIYAERHRVYAQTYVDSKSPKAAHAELAVVELRQMEAKAYEDMHRWRNAYDALREEIHSLKLKMRIDLADGTVGDYSVRAETRSEASA